MSTPDEEQPKKVKDKKKKSKKKHHSSSHSQPDDNISVSNSYASAPKKEKKRKAKSRAAAAAAVETEGGELKGPPEELIAQFKNAAAMPGVKMERMEDLSHAERLKYGEAKSGDSASAASSAAAAMPGIKMERSEDLSNAERLKYGENKPAASPNSNVATMPGVKTEKMEDVSKAERLKYGLGSNRSPMRSNRDIMQMAKSKSRRLNMQPRELQGDDSEVGEAEQHNMAGDNDSDQEEGESNLDGNEELSSEKSAIQENEDDECSNNFDIESNSDRSMTRSRSKNKTGLPKRRRSLVERYADFTYGIERDDEDDYYDDEEGEVKGKRDADIWKPCCLIISFLSLVIIIALSASLGASNKQLANSEPVVVVDPESSVNVVATVDPSQSPSLAPTIAPVDYSSCYDTEEEELQDERYSSIRSEIVSSGITSADEFSDASSYQRKALCWLTFGDSLLSLNQTDPFLMQRYALATIYFALNESQILLDRGWLSGKPECQWTPLVECDSRTDSTVTRLSLHSNELVGELPKEMGYLQHTYFLDMSINQISDANSLQSWSKLKSLGLGTNILTQIPDVSSFPYLEHLDVSGNGIEGVIPEELASNTNLVYLDLSENNLEETIPASLGSLVSLKTLLMDYNSLNGSMPSEICDLRKTNLDKLVADCQIPNPQIECPFPTCCNGCGFGGQDSGEGQGSNPFQT